MPTQTDQLREHTATLVMDSDIQPSTMLSQGYLITSRARELIHRIASDLRRGDGVSSMSTSIYDTAWIALVRKPSEAGERWLFPSAFQHILAEQQTDGGWSKTASDIDGILNTMASLIALKKHLLYPCDSDLCASRGDLTRRIVLAITSLQNQLIKWNVDACMHVGFEVLVPRLLAMLETDGPAFKFGGRETLMLLKEQKLAKFDERMLYSQHQSTMVHSLEAFADRIDMEKVKHHLVNGSMMGSPSATAAYLMHCKAWDETAEGFLYAAIENGTGKGTGAVPSAYPTTIFEVAWVLSTLLEHGMTVNQLGEAEVLSIANFLEDQLLSGDGNVGFAPGVLSDADDTAKTITTLNLLGRYQDPTQMLMKFEAEKHFITYFGERNASISANCNILICLLRSKEPNRYCAQIMKAIRFVVEAWNRGALRDKWNLSWGYSSMLVARALVQMLRLWDEGALDDVDETYIRDEIPILGVQIVTSLLRSQNACGSWGDGHVCEDTAYAVISIRTLGLLPWFASLRSAIDEAIDKGARFLSSTERWMQGDYIWIEKVTYRSSNLSQVYCIAAVVSQGSYRWGMKVASMLPVSIADMATLVKFFSQLSLFSNVRHGELDLSVLESKAFFTRLQGHRLDIFSRKHMSKDLYLTFIPFTWVAVNNIHRKNGAGSAAVLDNHVLWSMMMLSMLNYQADEFMETEFEQCFVHRFDAAHCFIDQLCDENFGDAPIATKSNLEIFDKAHFVPGLRRNNRVTVFDGMSRAMTSSPSSRPSERKVVSETHSLEGADKDRLAFDNASQIPHESSTSSNTPVRVALDAYIKYVVQHPAALSAPNLSQQDLQFELRQFLHAHVRQSEASKIFFDAYVKEVTAAACVGERTGPTNQAVSGDAVSRHNQCCFEPFYTWATGTAADHTSCPFSYHFFCTLVASATAHVGTCSRAIELFPSAASKYFSAALARHLAAMCRLYNDAGSITRDREERNLNVADFAAFRSHGRSMEESQVRSEKSALLSAAGYERACLNEAFRRLNDEKSHSLGVTVYTIDALRVFVDVTDLYGQIYLARDIASRHVS